MAERDITEQEVLHAIDFPDRMHVSTKTTKRFVAKKLMRTNRGHHLLMVIYEINGQETVVITIIDTSKIEKYY